MQRNFTQFYNYKKNIDNHIEQAKQAGKSKVVFYNGRKLSGSRSLRWREGEGNSISEKKHKMILINI